MDGRDSSTASGDLCARSVNRYVDLRATSSDCRSLHYPFVCPRMNHTGAGFLPTDILGPKGRIAARLPNYEVRPQQLEMAEAVSAALQGKRHLIVEAGTGVGKSF